MPASRDQLGLVEVQDRFVAAWGRMASTWGISRTMAEAHALLYITGRPLCTDDVMDRLQISRGNASMSLRGLVDWGIVSRMHKRGDRKEYFQAEQDVWTMFRAAVRERIQREVEPRLACAPGMPATTGGCAPTAKPRLRKRLEHPFGFAVATRAKELRTKIETKFQCPMMVCSERTAGEFHGVPRQLE